MNNENIIIAMVFLVIVALFAFNFSKMTGFAPAEKKDDYAPTINLYKTDIYEKKVIAKTVNAGEEIDIEIKINKGNINPEFKVYSVRDGIVGTRKKVVYFSPNAGDCKQYSKGANIPCGGPSYGKGKLKNDLIKKSFGTESNWKGKYIVRIYYFGEKNEKLSKDSDEFTVF